MDQKNLIIELRRRVNAIETNQSVFIDVEPKNPKTSTVWVRTNGDTKYWNWSNWVIGWGMGVLTDLNTTVEFTATDYRVIAWSAGVVSIGTRDSKADYTTTAGNVTMTATTYFFWKSDSPTSIQTTTTAGNVVIAGGILLAVGRLNTDTTNKASIKAFGWPTVDLMISDNIVANSITTNMLQANSITAAKLSVTLLYAGAITLDTNGLIKGGQTAYDTGTGFFLGYSWATYRLSIGNSVGNKLTWDGTSLAITGTITATAGTIGGTTITPTTLTGGIIQTASGTWQRIVIESNLLKAYDASNILRSQIISGGIRMTESVWAYSSDISASVYDNGWGIIWPSIQISDTSGSNRVWLRTAFVYGTSASTSLDLYLRWWAISFKWINNAVGIWVILTSADNDTLNMTGIKISFNGLILERIGLDLYWNAVKIN